MKKTGELLRKKREEKGLSLHEIALSLKINSKTLKAIEDGDLTQLPAKTFLRGFVQSYANFLKMNLEEVLTVFSEEMGPTRPQAPLTVNDSSPSAVEQNNRATEVVAFPRPAPAARQSMEPSAPTVSGIEQTSKAKAIVLSVVSLALVGLIVMTKKVIDRYQRESQSAPVAVVPIEQPATQDAIPDNPATGETATTVAAETMKPVDKPVEKVAETKPETKAETKPVDAKVEPTPAHAPAPAPAPAPNVAAPTASPTKAPTATAPISSMIPTLTGADILKNISKVNAPNSSVAPKAETKPTEPAKTAETKTPPKAEAPKPIEPTKTAEQAKPAEPAKTADAAKPAEAKPEEAKPAEVPKKSLELIVEALDAVEIEFSGASGAAQKIQLGADQVHTIHSKGALKVQISNGGAVNLTLNGRDLGVPGDLGKPIKLSY